MKASEWIAKVANLIALYGDGEMGIVTAQHDGATHIVEAWSILSRMSREETALDPDAPNVIVLELGKVTPIGDTTSWVDLREIVEQTNRMTPAQKEFQANLKRSPLGTANPKNRRT